MNRRKFLSAVAPMIAFAGSVQGQLESGQPAGGASGRLAPDGKPAPAPAPAGKAKKGPTEIISREAMIDNRIHLATFTGEVEVKDPEFNLTCDKLTVYLRKPDGDAGKSPAQPRAIGAENDPEAAPPKTNEKQKSGIDKAIAEGNVIITQEKLDASGKMQKYFGKAKRAVFDNNKQTCVLSGWPRISQSLGGNLGKQIIATQESTVITLDQAGAIKADGPNKVTLTDVSAFESGKKEPR